MSTSRTNILQAPKVTLFNGQTAFVSDTTNRPFVTSIIPVVGDFAVGQMPVIVVLNEGTSLSVQAVVSSDRRFTRLTLVPFFSQVGQVDEFTFSGTTTTNSGTTVQDPTNPDKTVTNSATKSVTGGGRAKGGSTITQQVAKYLLKDSSYNIGRKVRYGFGPLECSGMNSGGSPPRPCRATSSPVRMHRIPAQRRARLVSTDLMRAWAWLE